MAVRKWESTVADTEKILVAQRGALQELDDMRQNEAINSLTNMRPANRGK